MNPYADEEDLLSFHVFVAELELLSGTRRDRAIDRAALLELLQKLMLSLEHTDLRLVKEYQRRCEQTLVSLLMLGLPSEVRTLVCLCLSKLYAVGDRLPLFSQVNSIQGVMLSKDALGKKLSDNSKLGLLACLTVLCRDHGAHLISSLPSLVSVGVKHSSKSSSSNEVRLAAAKLVAEALLPLSGDSRHSVPSQAEALKLAERHIQTARGDDLRLSGLKIIQSVCRAGAAALWIQGGAPFDAVFKTVSQTIHDSYSSREVRRLSGAVLGELMAALKSPMLQEEVRKETRENKKASLQKISSKTFVDFVSLPFCDAAVSNKKVICAALSSAWTSYIGALKLHTARDENCLVSLSITFVNMLSKLPAVDLKSRDASELTVELGHGLATGEFPIAQACILCALRTGAFRCLAESGQRKLVEQLGTLLSGPLGNSVPVAVVSLEGIRVLLSILGEVSPETASDLGITFMEKLASNSSAIRSQASAALGSLVSVDPACAATLIASSMEFLKNQIEQLVSLSARFGAMHPMPSNFLPNVPEVYSLPEDAVKKSQDSKIRETMHAVYGYASGLAALLVAASRTFLNVPSKLYNEAFGFAKQLISEPQSTVAKSWAIEMKAGYCILGGLCASMPSQLLKSKGDLLSLWEPALGATAQALMLDKELMKQGKEIDLALQLWWRSEGLLSLEAYIKAVLESPLCLNPKQEAGRIVDMLWPLLEGLVSNEALLDPGQTAGGFGGWIAGTVGYLQLRLLSVFYLLPEASAYAKINNRLVKLCSKPFSPSSSLLTSPATAAAVSGTLLRGILQNGDDHLGPWELEEEPLEEELMKMTGEKGGPHYAAWECGMPVWGIASVGVSDTKSRIEFEPSPFPQYTSLPVALVRIQVLLFGKMMTSVGSKNRVQLLESLIACAKSIKSTKNLGLEEALLSCICASVLSAKDKPRTDEEVSRKILELSAAVMDSGSKSVSVIRAAAEMAALSAQLSDDAAAARTSAHLCKELSSATASDRQRFLLLTVASMFRSRGGICFQSVLPKVVSLLFELICKSDGDLLLWSLHCLCLVSSSAGLVFMPYVHKTLQLAERLMTSREDIPALRPYLGRLTNAMVALLGPELLPGSRNYQIVKCLMGQMKSEVAETVAGALESVLYAQQVILFAPQAVPAKKHVAILLESLNQPHPPLRYNSAIALRHLTERDPQTICEECIEKPLFRALDGESVAHIADALRLTLEALQAAQCPARPSVWLDVCGSLVLLHSSESKEKGRVLHKEDSLMREEDIEESGEEIGDERGLTPKLKTRMFAAHCLLKIFKAVGEDPRHFDLVKAKQSEDRQEFLVCQLQDIVRLGFSLSTGQVESLQPEGIKLLDSIILHFGDADDPDMEDTKLLFQFQAQFVSPLRQALAPVAPPLLFMSGATLAVSFLRSGLGGGDSAVLKQLVGLLVEPIMNWNQLQYRNFSEWVSASVRVALLEAHAHCTVLAETGNDRLCSEIVGNAQRPIVNQLKNLWLGLLTDYMVLNRWQKQLWSDYAPSVICLDEHAIDSADKISLGEAWPIVLRALALHIPPAEKIDDGDQEGGVSSREMYGRLLDITTVRLGTSSMKVIEQAKSEEGSYGGGLDIEPICICVRVLKTLLSPEYLSIELCPPEICLEIVEMIMSIIQQVIHPIVCSSPAEERHKLMQVVLSASELLSGVASGLSEKCIEYSGFIPAFMDCILCCSSILSADQEMEGGRIDCALAAEKAIKAADWGLVKDWLGTILEHALKILGEESVSEELVIQISQLLKTSIAKLASNGGEIVNGNETLSSAELVSWTVMTLLDLIKEKSNQPDFAKKRTWIHLLYTCLCLQAEHLATTSQDAEPLQRDLSEFISAKLSVEAESAVQIAALNSLKRFLQEATVVGEMTELCVVTLGPKIASLAHEKISEPSSSELVLVAECLKYLVLTLNLPDIKGKERTVFRVVIPLLVESMESSAPQLVQVGFKLVTHLNGSKHVSAFKSAIADLSQEMKLRFQQGIQNAAESESRDPASGEPSSRQQKPSIELRNFSAK